MQKPSNWDTVQPQTFSGSDRPESGAYIFGIIKEEQMKSSKDNDMLVLSLDIIDGKFKNYYRKLSEKISKDCLLKHRRTVTENSLPYFKGDIKAIEESNPGFKYEFIDNSLRGKQVGGMLQEEEYLAAGGEVKTIMKLAFLCSVETAKSGKLKPLPTKHLDMSFPPPPHEQKTNDVPLPWDE